MSGADEIPGARMIEHIRIRNFKSLRDVSVDLSPVTVLIGRSGVGKSNFLQAIRFLRNFLVSGTAPIGPEGGWPGICPFGVPAELAFDVRFRLPGYDQTFEYGIAWKPIAPEARLHHERLAFAGKSIFERSASSWSKWPGLGQEPKDFTRSYLSTFPMITEAVLAYTAWTSGVGWHDFPATVFAEAAPKGTGRANPRADGLDDSANNYLDILREITQDLRDQGPRRHMLARVKQINPTVGAIELDSVLGPTTVIVTHVLGDQRVALNLSQESDGFRRYYAHLLALYQTPPKQLLMFEEPENGIYPGALRNLAEEFKSAAEAGRGQVLLTTQSPDLLDGFEPESLRVVDLDDQQATRIAPLDSAQLLAVKDQLLEPGELLTVTAPKGAAIATAQ